MNAIECLQAIEDLREARAALQAGMMAESKRIITRFRYPGEWGAERFFVARKIASDIVDLLEPRQNSRGLDDKSFMLRKLAPLVEAK